VPDKKGTLVVKTEPEGAYVRIAGELQGGKTPLTVEKLPLGSDIEVKISLEGYETAAKIVHFTEGDLEDEISTRLVKGSVTVVFEVKPAGAIVVVDDKRWEGKGNRIEELSAGDHKLVFSAPGHLPQIVKLTAKKGETKELDVLLKKGDPSTVAGGTSATADKGEKGAPGTVRVNSKGGFCANVTVGGKSGGPTPAVVSGVGPGPVAVSCKTQDGRTLGSGANVPPGGTTSVTIVIK
jgi:hypothetical protein